MKVRSCNEPATKRFKAFLLSTAVAAFLFNSNPTNAISTEEGFESGSIAGYEKETQGGGRFEIISGNAREGSRFIRITKNKGARRYELRLATHSKPTELWYGFSMRLQSDMQNTDEYFILAQWAHFPDRGEEWHRPDAFLRLNRDYRLAMSYRWDSRRITPRGGGEEGKRSNIPLLTMNRGQWYDFVIRYRYSYNDDGLIEIYGAREGNQLQLLERLTGPNCFNDARGQFRIGPYGAENDFTASIDYDAVRFGTSLDEVKPR